MWKVDLGYGDGVAEDRSDMPDERGRAVGDMTDMILASCDYGYGDQDDDPYDGGWWPKEIKTIKCNKCGSTDVIWKQVPSGKWCLHTNGKPHVCENKVLPKSVPRTGKNSNKKELTGYRLVDIKVCSTCVSYNDEDEECDEHDYSVVINGYCNSWKSSYSASRTVQKREYFPQMKSQPKSIEQSIQERYNNAKICPHCGDRAGFSMGTGDCGCESSPDVGW